MQKTPARERTQGMNSLPKVMESALKAGGLDHILRRKS
jgi:hypothetical protein